MNNILKNKKAFTLLEVMIAVAMFAVVSLMTFTVINSYPKLVRSEINQFGERTNVRRAMVSISNTIRQSKAVADGSVEFEQTNGDIITFNLVDDKIKKIVRHNNMTTETSFLADSLADFSIKNNDNKYFEVHLKTKEEGKDYDYSVTRINNTSTKLRAISTISPSSVTFNRAVDKNLIPITLNLRNNVFINIYYYDDEQAKNIILTAADYNIDGNGNYVINGSFFADKPNGPFELTFDVGLGIDPVLAINITGTLANKIAATISDGIVTMRYPDNKQVSSFDNTWKLVVSPGTVADDISSGDLEFTGLPEYLYTRVTKGTGNAIIIEVSGAASDSINQISSLKVKIKTSAVNETNMQDSDEIPLALIPGYIPNVPENNIIYSNEMTIINNAFVYGDVFLGRGTSMVYMRNNVAIYGNLYVDSNLTVDNCVLGSMYPPSQIFVKGTVKCLNNAWILGDLYHEGNIEIGNNVIFFGVREQRHIDIPAVNIPALKTEQGSIEKWYLSHGYTVVPKSTSSVTFKKNGKYYFMQDYVVNYDSKRRGSLDNVIMASAGNLTFNNNFTGSGVIFAPNGKIEFGQNSAFTGITSSKNTILNNNCVLIYKKYTELPF